MNIFFFAESTTKRKESNFNLVEWSCIDKLFGVFLVMSMLSLESVCFIVTFDLTTHL